MTSRSRRRPSTTRTTQLYWADGSTKLDAMGSLWCVNVGYGREELAGSPTTPWFEYPSVAVEQLHPQIELATKISDLLDWGAGAAYHREWFGGE